MSSDSKLGLVFIVFAIFMYSPSVLYVVFAFLVSNAIYTVSFVKGRVTAVLSIMLPLLVWCGNRAYFEYEKRLFDAETQAVQISPKPRETPSTLVIIGDQTPDFIPKCFPNVLLSSTDPTLDANADFSYPRWDERNKRAEKPRLPVRYLILRVGTESRFWRKPYRPADHTPYEISVVDGASQELIALKYSFPKRPSFFPPLVTLGGLLPVSDNMTLDEVSRRITAFIREETHYC